MKLKQLFMIGLLLCSVGTVAAASNSTKLSDAIDIYRVKQDSVDLDIAYCGVN